MNSITRRLLRPAPTHLYHQDAPDSGGPFQLQWHGTAAFTVNTPDRTLVLDPFVTRPSLLKMLGPLQPNEPLIHRVFPKADDVIIGHAHYDHVLDGPTVAKHTGARFIGCPSACNVARAGGVDEAQLLETRGDEDIACGPNVTVRGIPSVHGKVYGVVPLQGTIDTPPAWPPRNRALRHGIVFNWWMHLRNGDQALRVLHVDSAEFFAERVAPHRADVLCLCAIGRNYRPRYLEELLELTGARWVVPCHWDWLFTPYDADPLQLPGVDLEGFAAQIEAHGATPIILPFGGVWTPPSCTA